MKQLFDRLDMSQTDFAAKAGLPRNGVSQFVTGARPMTHQAALKIQAAFPQVSLNWLLKGEGEMFLDPRKGSGTPTPPENATVKTLRAELENLGERMEALIAKENATAKQVADLENELMRLKARLFDEMEKRGAVLPGSDLGVVNLGHSK